MYKLFLAGLDNGPMNVICKCDNKYMVMDAILRIAPIVNVKARFVAIPDPDSGLDYFEVESLPLIQERAAKLQKNNGKVQS